MWPSSSRGGGSTPLGYGLPPELGMFVVAPATFHHATTAQHDPLIPSPDPHTLSGSNASTSALGVGVIPLLTAAPCLNNASAGCGGAIEEGDIVGGSRGGRGGGALQLWQAQQQQSQPHAVDYLKKGGSLSFGYDAATVNLLGSSGAFGEFVGGGLSGVGGAGGVMTCQDCGNQAKKDCSHRRCRTCCRSRGFDCATHVKSTWVPAARRRERQMLAASGAAGGGSGGGGDGASSGSTSGAKKPRLITSQNTTTTSHTSTSNNTPSRSYDTSSSHKDASLKERLPGQVRAPAVFKCVRVTAVDDGEDEYAYQAVVRIGGHVFKGFLYDQGIEARDGFPNLSELHLGGSSGGNGGERRSGGGALLDPSEVYGAVPAGGGGAGLLGGSSFGNTIN